MKILIIDQEGLALDFALRCVDAGHEVRWFRIGKSRDGEGFKGITQVPDWRSSMPWAKSGLVLTTGNFKFIAELDAYRKLGYKIFSPTKASADLEINRSAGMDAMKKVGIDIPPYTMFNSLEDAAKFARKSNDCFVFKTMGDEADKSLTYVSCDPADMTGWIEQKIARGMVLKGPCMLQEKIDMLCEFGVSGWMGPGGFLKDKWQIAFEHKKLMDHEIGPATGEQGCYSADTEVLTDNGWKFWPEVTVEDRLATLIDGNLAFETPSALVEFDCLGEMVQWKNRSIDILVTPNHNMYVAGQSSARKKAPNFKFVQASECTEAQYLLKRTAGWIGQSPKFRIFAGNAWDNGKCIRTTPDISVEFSAWSRLLGLWFAEGSASGRRINIAQSHPEKSAKAEKIIASTGLAYIRRNNGFDIGCAQIARELSTYGRSYEKRVPAYIKDASSNDIAAFLDGFALGDAHTQANGSRIFYTSNPGLADDLQGLMLRCGRLGIIKKLKAKKNNGFIDGREIIQRRPAYAVYERARKITGWLDNRDRKLVPHKGKVYCATVSSHLLFVRRNGKPVWCGNTVCQYQTSELLAEECLVPMEKIARKLGHIGDFAVNVGIDKKGKAWPFEFTSRLGWPAFYLQTASHKGDPAQWMLDLLNGHDTLKVTQDVCIGVVCSQPPYPQEKFKPEEVEGNPISGLDGVWDHIHPAMMMIAKGPVMKGGKVIDAPSYQTSGPYVLVATGLGKSLETAKKSVYDTISKISFANIMHRTDIGDKVAKAISGLHQHGYALGMKSDGKPRP